MASVALYLNILTVVLLALVAGLLLVLHFQLRTWREASREAPLLAEKLTEAMLSARKGLSDLRHELVGQGPELNRLISEGDKLRVELQFLMQRGAQMAERLDEREGQMAEDFPVVRLSAAAQAAVEQVAGANGLAAKPMVGTVGAHQGDPLEELLANLQAPPEPRKVSGKRKRVGPVTQAELDLQQSLKRSEA